MLGARCATLKCTQTPVPFHRLPALRSAWLHEQRNCNTRTQRQLTCFEFRALLNFLSIKASLETVSSAKDGGVGCVICFGAPSSLGQPHRGTLDRSEQQLNLES
jgi:hypothetical protein